jgi:hypothetical protein
VQDLQIHLEVCMDQRLLQVLAQDPFWVFSHHATWFAGVPPT